MKIDTDRLEAAGRDRRPPVVSAQSSAETPTVPLRRIASTFWPYAATRKGWMALLLACSALDPLLMAAEIWLFKVVVDEVIVPRDFGPFPLIAAAYVGLTLVQAALGGTDRMLSTWLTQRFLLDLRSDLLRHVQRLPLAFFTRSRSGDLMARLAGDVSAIESFLVSGTSRALRYALELVVFTIALFVLDPLLAAVSLIVAPVFWSTSRTFSRRLKQVSRERQRRSGSISTSIEQTLSTMALVHAFDAEEREVQRYQHEAEAKYRAEMASARLRSVYAPTIDLVELLGALAVIGVGAWQLGRGALTVGALLAFLTFLSRLYGPIKGIGSTVTSAYSAAAGAERVIELLDQRPMPPDRPGAHTLVDPVGDVRVEWVGYRYEGQVRPALDDVSFVLRPGEVTAVVGASGAGKSTLVGLVLRALDPTTGRVTLDGHDLRDLTRSSLRRHVAVVQQETVLVAGSVRDNIAYGRPEASDEQIRAAARTADAAGFIEELPQGYETLVGERGRRLSGGQAQRIAIARALLCDAPVLVLDEPTASLDAASTERVLAPLNRLMSGRATLVISHNLSAARHADHVLVLDGGRVVERGRHADLLAADGAYASLWRLAGHHDGADTMPIRTHQGVAS